jgi:hypothetical protein
MRLLAAVLLVTTGPAQGAPLLPAAPPASLAVTDKAPQPINELYVSPVTSDDWGDDRLGDVTIKPGRTRDVRLDGLHDCTVDIRVVYGDATSEERHEVDICRTRQVTFDGTAASPGAVAGNARHSVVIVNGASRPIQQVLIAPAQAGDWGDDLLAAGSLSVGDRTTVSYRGDCLEDMRIVYDNRSAEERRDLDLCGLHGVVVQPGWTTADHLAPLPAQTASAPASGPAP